MEEPVATARRSAMVIAYKKWDFVIVVVLRFSQFFGAHIHAHTEMGRPPSSQTRYTTPKHYYYYYY